MKVSILLLRMSSGDFDVKTKIGKLEADIEVAKAGLQSAEDAHKDNLILSYNTRLAALAAQLTELLKLLPRPGKICPICSHSLLFLYILFIGRRAIS